MSTTFKVFTVFCLTVVAVGVGAAEPQETAGQTGFVPTTKIEKAAMAVFEKYSEAEMQEIQTFFAPIVQKWTPTAQQFAEEYMASTNRNAVVSKYLPKARTALDEAKQMKVEQKDVTRRDQYVMVAEALYSVISVYDWYNRKVKTEGPKK